MAVSAWSASAAATAGRIAAATTRRISSATARRITSAATRRVTSTTATQRTKRPEGWLDRSNDRSLWRLDRADRTNGAYWTCGRSDGTNDRAFRRLDRTNGANGAYWTRGWSDRSNDWSFRRLDRADWTNRLGGRGDWSEHSAVNRRIDVRAGKVSRNGLVDRRLPNGIEFSAAEATALERVMTATFVARGGSDAGYAARRRDENCYETEP